MNSRTGPKTGPEGSELGRSGFPDLKIHGSLKTIEGNLYSPDPGRAYGRSRSASGCRAGAVHFDAVGIKYLKTRNAGGYGRRVVNGGTGGGIKPTVLEYCPDIPDIGCLTPLAMRPPSWAPISDGISSSPKSA